MPIAARRGIQLPLPQNVRDPSLHFMLDPQLSLKTLWLDDILNCSCLAEAARLKLAAPLIGKGGAVPGRNATAGSQHCGGCLVPLSIATTVRGRLLATAKLSACLTLQVPQMSGVSKTATKQWHGEGRAWCWLRIPLTYQWTPEPPMWPHSAPQQSCRHSPV